MTESFDLLGAQRRVFSSGLSSTEKLVALAMLDHWSVDSPMPWPSLPRLAELTSFDRATVQKAVKSLRAKGAVTAIETPGRATRYDLRPLMVLPVAQNDGSRTATGRGERPHPSRRTTTPVAHDDPKEPMKEPMKEPIGPTVVDAGPVALPSSYARAVEVPIQLRATLAVEKPDAANWAQAYRWPEVVDAAELLSEGLGLRKPRLAPAKDSGVDAILRILAAGYTIDDIREAAPRISSHGWLAGKKNLAAVTVPILRELLEDPSVVPPAAPDAPATLSP